MTLIVAGIGVVICALAAALAAGIGSAASLRAHAQLAADASALAAAAESGPYGEGRPEKIAREFAAANGARLLECRCAAGATAVQVKVAVNDAVAEARAVIDPLLFAPGHQGGELVGLDPRLAAAVSRLIAATGGAVTITSGARSSAEQAQLWQQALEQYGSAEAADDWVAPPGHSMHERGLAVDLSGDLALAMRLIERLDLPLWRPLSNEPWHFELIGSR